MNATQKFKSANSVFIPVEHIFGISVDSANKLVASEMTDTNEKDCFIQYQFPEQKQKETGKNDNLGVNTHPTM